ncbi:MAG: S-methyl-5-thioribose-1-phosphate isomerase [Fervidicoccaceae archaeon]
MSGLGKSDHFIKKLEILKKEVDIVPVYWKDGKVAWLDVTQIPWKEEVIETSNIDRLAEAIKKLEIRGAPAIGIAAALGIAMAAYNAGNKAEEVTEAALNAALKLSQTRPTAVNLFWAIERMKNKISIVSSLSADEIKDELLAEALSIQIEDIEGNLKMGEIGESLIESGDKVLTHCNTGSLATGGYGTALGVIKTAWRKGKEIFVVATETRPLLQGARLTAWELKKEGIPFRLITDGMVGYIFASRLANKAIVGADRILLSGHVINKIGTYVISSLANQHGYPFYVAAPTSTIDKKTDISQVKIENRSEEEVTTILGKLRIAPDNVRAFNPAFDITPPELVKAIITERGIASGNLKESLKNLIEN